MKSITFIINPIAGGGKKVQKIINFIHRYLDKEKYIYDIKITAKAGDATELASLCNSDIVCSVGGDGTVNEVARGILGTSKILAILPCGSGNGFALHLGISRNIRKAIAVINDGHVVVSDVGFVNDTLFLCTSGIGLDAAVSAAFERSSTRGLKTYIIDTFKIWKDYSPHKYIIEHDSGVWHGPAYIVCVGNANQWGNNAFITPLASVVDGVFDIAIIRKINALNCLPLLCRLLTKSIHKSKSVTYLRTSKCNIQIDWEQFCHVDGEPYSCGRMFEYHNNQSSLKVVVPEKSVHYPLAVAKLVQSAERGFAGCVI